MKKLLVLLLSLSGSLLGIADDTIALPAEYTRVEYLYSAGDAKGDNAPYIDLGYKPNERTGIDIEFELVSFSVDFPCPFGVCHEGNAKAFTLTGSYNSDWVFRWSSASSTSKSFTTPSRLGRHTLVTHGKTWALDGEARTWSVDETFSLDYNLYVFGRNNKGTLDMPANMKLYGLRIYEGDDLKHWLVPCMRNADWESGLYDCAPGVQKKFYTNAGTGKFVVPSVPWVQVSESQLEALPADYCLANYLYSAGDAMGDNAPYIDLGYKPNERTGIDIEFELVSFSVDYPCPFGVCHTGNAKAFTLTGSYNSDWSFRWSSASSTSKSFTNPSRLGRHTLVTHGKTWALDGEAQTWSVDETFALDYNLYVFGRDNNGKLDMPANMKLYGFRIFEGTSLLHYFVPCVRKSDRKPGLYDRAPGVEKRFYTNAGSGEFAFSVSVSVEGVPAVVSADPRYRPHPQVRSALVSAILGEETDYVLSWTDIGAEGSVTVSGKDVYDDAVIEYRLVEQSEETFFINPIEPLSVVTAGVCTPHPVVQTFDRSRVLSAGTDYELQWYDNWKVGQGYVVIVGKGDFAGKAWTEPFQILPRLKGGYTAVAYIRSSGSQYINTGVKPVLASTRADYRFEMEDFADVQDFAVPFGSRNANTYQFFVGAARTDGRDDWFRRFGSASEEDTDIYRRKPPVVGPHFFSLSTGRYDLDGVLTQFPDSALPGVQSEFYDAYVFAVNNNNVAAMFAPMKLYSLKIWDNGMLLRDFVPCVNSEGVAGLYDMTPGATKLFYPSEGSNAFEAGPKAKKEGLVIFVL